MRKSIERKAEKARRAYLKVSDEKLVEMIMSLDPESDPTETPVVSLGHGDYKRELHAPNVSFGKLLDMI